MNICVISGGYPSPSRPEYPFVEELCAQWARQGHSVTVIAPQSYTKNILRRLPSVPYRRDVDYEGSSVRVYSPQYFSLSNIGSRVAFISNRYRVAVEKGLSELPDKPDLIYGHFWHNAYAAYRFAKRNDIPLFVASGEAEIEQKAETAEEKAFTDYVSAVVCVSTKNLKESISRGLTIEQKCKVFPNAIDSKLFYKRDRLENRELLGLEDSDFVVAFVGSMIPRKGPDRVSAAIKLLNDTTIKSMFIGHHRDGSPIVPDCDGIIHFGKLPHNQIPEYLSAADVFVLPTLHEGCCNAIVEAMACGLPIISSNLEFNYDVLDKSNSIMVNPLDIDEIAAAIQTIKNDSNLREELAEGALKKAKPLTIDRRAADIIQFISERLGKR